MPIGSPEFGGLWTRRDEEVGGTLTSELLKVPGIGPVKRRRLLQEFGSIQGVREASEEAISKVPGFNAEQARRLLETLAASSPV